MESYSHSRKGDAEYETCMEEISDRNRNDRCTRTVSRMCSAAEDTNNNQNNTQDENTLDGNENKNNTDGSHVPAGDNNGPHRIPTRI